MATLLIEKVNSLPVTLVANTLYIVKSTHSQLAELYLSDNTGSAARKLPTYEDLSTTITSLGSQVSAPNKAPLLTSSGYIDNDYVDIIPSISKDALHRSPNAVTAMFIYDTTKDSDGGMWTNTYTNTSWYNETLSGKWLGRLANEAGARVVLGATTNDYYQQISDGKFYKLNAGTGITEVFRGNKASFPKIVAIVAESASITLYDLTEPNYPMWMRFIAGNVGNGDMFTANIIDIKALNGIMCVAEYNSLGGIVRILFPEDRVYRHMAQNSYSKANGVWNGYISDRALKLYYTRHPVLGTFIANNESARINMLMLPNAITNTFTSLPTPTILVTSTYSETTLFQSNGLKYGIVSGVSGTTSEKPIAANSRIILHGSKYLSSSSFGLYYLPVSGISPSYVPPYAKYEYDTPPYPANFTIKDIVSMASNRFLLHDGWTTVHQIVPNVSTFSKSMVAKITDTEQTGWVTGNIKRTYITNKNISDTTGLIMSDFNYRSRTLGGIPHVMVMVDIGNGVVLAGTGSTGYVHRSTDYGQNFTTVQRLGIQQIIYSMVYLGNGIVLAGTYSSAEIYRSTDYGQSFTLVQRLGTESHVFSLIYLGDGIVLASTASNGQIYRSTDYGLSFTFIQRLGTEQYILKLCYLGNGIVLAGAGASSSANMFRSTDYGLTFTSLGRLGTESQVRSILYLGNGIVVVGTGDNRKVYRSTDYGLTYTLAQTLPKIYNAGSYLQAMCYLGNGVIVGGLTGNYMSIFLSIDYGLTFTCIQKNLYRDGSTIYDIVKLDNGCVLMGTYDKGIFKYSPAYIYGSLTKAPVATNADLTAYSGFSNANYIREPYSADLDFGTNEWHMSAWIKVPTIPTTYSTVTNRSWTGMTVLGNDIYACVANGDIYKQTNGTGNFVALGQTSRNWTRMTTLGTNVYACVYNGDIYMQTNGTGDFLPLGQTSRIWYGMAATATDVYACVYGGDIYKQTGGIGDFLPLGQTTRQWYGMAATATDVYAFINGTSAYKLTNGTGNFEQIQAYVGNVSNIIVLGTDVYCFSSSTMHKRIDGTETYQFYDFASNTFYGAMLGHGGYIHILRTNQYYKFKPVITPVVERSYTNGSTIALGIGPFGTCQAMVKDGTTSRLVARDRPYISTDSLYFKTWSKIEVIYLTDGSLSLYVNGVKQNVTYGAPLLTLNNSNAVLTIGNNYALDAPFPGSICHVKISGTAPTPDQITYAYIDEILLFNENTKCTLYDDSSLLNTVYDDDSDTWVSVSAIHRTQWSGLVRNTVVPVSEGSYTGVCAKSNILLEARSTSNPGVDYSVVSKILRASATKNPTFVQTVKLDYVSDMTGTLTLGSTVITNGSATNMLLPPSVSYYGAMISGTGIPADTVLYSMNGMSKPATASGAGVQISFKDYILPQKYTTVEVSVNGAMKQEGSSKDYTILYDGFREIVRFNTAPANSAWVSIKAICVKDV